jgi:membrane protease YdiL (CAAX protease family)
VFAVFVSTAAFALAALAAAVWIFKREEMILAEERGIPFTLNRAEFTPRETPTAGMGLFLYAVVLLLIFYVGTYAQAKDIIGGLLVTLWGLVLAPTLLFLVYTRTNIRKSLNLRLPPAGVFVGAAVIGVAWTALSIELNYLQSRVMPAPPAFAEFMSRLYQGRESGWSLAVLLFAAALSPAICEEALFRGAILSGFRSRWPAWLTVLSVGLLFGLFHISVYRVPIAAASGVVLTYLALRSGSIYPSVLMHFLLNALALLAVTQFGETLDAYGIEKRGEPIWVVLAALAAFIVGLGIFEASVRVRTRAAHSSAHAAGARS